MRTAQAAGRGGFLLRNDPRRPDDDVRGVLSRESVPAQPMSPCATTRPAFAAHAGDEIDEAT